MQQTSELYNRLYRTRGTVKEVKVTVGETVFNQNRIVSISTDGGMFQDDEFGIGGARSRTVNLVLQGLGSDDFAEIPKMARIQIQLRLVNGEEASEWIPKGTFFIDTRHFDRYSNRLEITGYDAMLKAENKFADHGQQEQWPKSDINAVRAIAERIGVGVDQRTVDLMTNGYNVEFPGVGDEGYTLREVLGFIGAMYAGNFVISDANELYLIALDQIPPELDLLITEYGDVITFADGVQLLVG